MEKISTNLSIPSQYGDSKPDSELTFDIIIVQTVCIRWGMMNLKHSIKKLTTAVLLKVLNGSRSVSRQSHNLEDSNDTFWLFVAKAE